MQCFSTVYVKALPGGPIRKLGIEENDTVWHLYNMFSFSTPWGIEPDPMMVLPTHVGAYELDCIIKAEDEHVTANTSGNLKMKRYGFNRRNGITCLFFFTRYDHKASPSLMFNYMKENTHYRIGSTYPMISHADGIPSEIEEDNFQSALRHTMEIQYQSQCALEKQQYDAIAKEYRRQREIARFKKIEEKYNESENAREDSLDRSHLRRLKSQMKGLSGDEKDKALKALSDRQAGMKRSLAPSESMKKSLELSRSISGAEMIGGAPPGGSHNAVAQALNRTSGAVETLAKRHHHHHHHGHHHTSKNEKK